MREAIVNAIAHRDYSSSAAVQVSVFADRVEVWNPGQLPSPLTPEHLRHPHSSIARNHRICEVLFLARYIEKFGTGNLMMIRESLAHALPEPDFVQQAGELVTTVWRDWLTEKVLAGFSLNERQQSAVAHVKANGRISNAEFQRLCRVPDRSAVRDLMGLVRLGLLDHEGTGRGAVCVLRRNRAINVPIVPKAPLGGASAKATTIERKALRKLAPNPANSAIRPEPGPRSETGTKGAKGVNPHETKGHENMTATSPFGSQSPTSTFVRAGFGRKL